MGWNFDKVLVSNYSDEIPMGAPAPTIAVSGRFVWACYPKRTTGDFKPYTTVKCFDILAWHRNILDDQYVVIRRPATYTNPILVTTIDGWAASIVARGDELFIGTTNSGSSFNTITVVATSGSDYTIDCPSYMNSDLVYENDKLWMASPSAYGRVLYWYSVKTRSFGSRPIPVRGQQTKVVLSNDHNSQILVCDFNNLSVSKFSSTDGAHLSTTRISAGGGTANREPSALTVDSNRNVYVASYNGMISRMDSTTDTFSMFSAGLGDVVSMADDGVHQWVATKKRASVVSHNGELYRCTKSHIGRGTKPSDTQWEKLSEGEAIDGNWVAGAYYVDDKPDVLRINKAAQTIRHFSTDERDIKIDDPAGVSLEGIVVNKITTNRAFTCPTTSGSVAIPKYVWLITETGTVVGLPTDAMFRPNNFELKGYAMMSAGQYDYTGD